jgi:hypothetical protein
MSNPVDSRGKPTFVAYIDESGDEGFRFHAGSSAWFVLSAVVTRKKDDLETVKLIDEIRKELKKPDKIQLHFRDLKHEQRLPYIKKIANANLRIITIMIHKPSLKEPEKFQQRYRLYFYGVRFLFERLSWYCRDHKTRHDAGDGSAEIIFSNRSGMSYDDLRDYFDLIKKQSGVLDVRIEWSVINPEQIYAFTPGRRMGLQIADAVASSYYYAVQPTAYGFTEDRYARMLKSVTYQRNGIFAGYGIKYWPRELDAMTSTSEHFAWLREAYIKK